MPGFSRLTTLFALRLPNALMRRLEAEAERRSVSVASLIVDALQEDFGEPEALPATVDPQPGRAVPAVAPPRPRTLTARLFRGL